MTLSVRFTKRAATEVERADAWWRENRTAVPQAIRDDLASLLRAAQSAAGNWPAGRERETGRHAPNPA